MDSPEKFLRTRARNLPLGPCYINFNWKEMGLAIILVSRKHSNGNFTWALFQVDLHCLGVKDTFWQFNQHPLDFKDTLSDLNSNPPHDPDNLFDTIPEGESFIVEESYPLLHNIIYGSLEYAEDLELKPHKDFSLTVHVLEPDDERIELIDIEFGLNGKPFIMPDDMTYPPGIVAHLDRVVGKGNYEVTYRPENSDDRFEENREDYMDEEYDEDDNEDEDEDEDEDEEDDDAWLDPFDDEELEPFEGEPDDRDLRDPLVQQELIDEFRTLMNRIKTSNFRNMTKKMKKTTDLTFSELAHLGDILYYNRVLTPEAIDQARKEVDRLLDFSLSEEFLSDEVLLPGNPSDPRLPRVRNDLRETARKTESKNLSKTLQQFEKVEQTYPDIPGISFLKLQHLGDEKNKKAFDLELNRLSAKFPDYPPFWYFKALNLLSDDETLQEGLAFARSLLPIQKVWPETTSFCDIQVNLHVNLLKTIFTLEEKPEYLDALIEYLEEALPELLENDPIQDLADAMKIRLVRISLQ